MMVRYNSLFPFFSLPHAVSHFPTHRDTPHSFLKRTLVIRLGETPGGFVPETSFLFLVSVFFRCGCFERFLIFADFLPSRYKCHTIEGG